MVNFTEWLTKQSKTVRVMVVAALIAVGVAEGVRGLSRIFIYSGLGFVLGLVIFFTGLRRLRQKRLIEHTPTSKARSIAMGLVELSGKAVSGKEMLKSPFSGKECVYHHYRIEEWRRRGKRSSWVLIKSDWSGTPFFLKDETGQVLVDPTDAEVDIPQDFQFETGLLKKKLPAEIERFVKTQGMSTKGWLGLGRRLRFTEHHIAPNDRLYVLGTAAKNPDVRAGTAATSAENIIITKGTHEKLYYISDRSEREVLTSMGWKTWGSVYGGAALALVCLAIILKYAGPW